MKYSSEEFLIWQRETQKAIKKDGFNFSYSKNSIEFKLYTQLEKGKLFIPIKVNLYNPIPNVVVNLKNSIAISEKSIGAVVSFLKNFVLLLKQNNQKSYTVDIAHNYWYENDQLKEMKRKLVEIGLTSIDENGRRFVDQESNKLLQQVIALREKVQKVYGAYKDDKTNPFMEIKTELVPNRLEIHLKDVIDRSYYVNIDYEEKIFRTRFNSKLHRKDVEHHSISYEIFQEDLKQFQDEERFKELFEGPKMNKVIEDYLGNMVSGIYIDVSALKVFNFLIEQELDVKDMSLMSVYPNKSTLHKKTDMKQTFKDNKSRYNDYLYRTLNTFIFKCYDKFLMIAHIDDKTDSYKDTEKNELFLFDTIEEAEKKEKEWLINQL